MKLYLHIPFCKNKCLYCDFKSFPCSNDDKIDEYLDCLGKEISLAGKEFKDREITSVYFGGGTPSLLSVEQFTKVFQTLTQSFHIKNDIEITAECNPESVTADKLLAMRSLGVNRISLGVQSLCDDNLRAIGRVHDRRTALEKIKLIKEYFSNLSVDFIVGLPFDTDEKIVEELVEVAPLVEHISVYTLSVEAGTPLEKLVSSGKMTVADCDKQMDLFDIACKTLSSLGFERYEISNFSKNGKRSNHNTGYWTREEYLGIGLNASSLVKNLGNSHTDEVRLKNSPNMENYQLDCRNSNEYFEIQRDIDILTAQEIHEETVMLALRLSDGIDRDVLGEKADILLTKFKDYVVEKSGKIALNNGGMDVMNHILVEIL
ncbi:MAG: radical SAM family heme chaperone HemW [Clostridia bacterium]|nr:radical SAM family heme chaperone HemW [Clostridia bacterium]